MSSCIVVFPLYKTPNKLEPSFLENGLHKTKDHKHIIIAPEELLIDESFGKLVNIEVKRFNKHYFESIQGYNRLLLSKDFYASFIDFEYMLVHQTDVYLFKDELDYWCIIEQIKIYFKKNKTYANRHNKVGNGGLSLRRIGSALKVLSNTPKKLLDQYLSSNSNEYNEDIFWSLEAPLILSDYKTPKWQEAIHFAVEFKPAISYRYLNETLPFGCHAPLKHEPEFWKKFIPQIK